MNRLKGQPWRAGLGVLGIYLSYVVVVVVLVSISSTEMAGLGILLINLPAVYLLPLPRILIVGFVANCILFFVAGAAVGWVVARTAEK